MSKITVIFGPTASGKTRKATELAQKTGAALLSFDSRHVYKDMSIVTGKDLPAIEPERVFGFDLVTPDQDWSTFHFYEYAAPIIEKLQQENTPLIIFGGSWPYAHVLFRPPESLGVPVNEKLRAELDHYTVEKLQERTFNENPLRWSEMNDSDRCNPRRLIRAIEVADAGGESATEPLFTEFETIFLQPKIEELEANIAKRVEERWQTGAIEETRLLAEKYPDWSKPAFSSTGYRYILGFIDNMLTEQEAKDLWITQERQYAKRQMTWLKKITARA